MDDQINKPIEEEYTRQTVDGFEFEFIGKPLGRNQDSDSYDFRFEIGLKNHTGQVIHVVSRLIRILDGNGSEVHQKSSSVRKVMRLNPGDTLKFEGTCPLPMPVGSVQCELNVKDGDDLENTKPRSICSPPFHLVNENCLH